MTSVLVSAIVPVFNGARYLAEAIDSALAQTHDQMEIVVVDDGSTDDSARVIASYGEKIRAFHQPNRGVAAARNRALAEARGTFVAMLDQDDLWHPHKTARQLEVFAASPATALVWCRHRTSDPRVGAPQDSRTASDLLLRCGVACLTAMARRDAVRSVGGFDERAQPSDDWDAWIRLSRLGEIVCVPEELATWRVHPGQVSNDRKRMALSEAFVLRKHQALIEGLERGHTHFRDQLAIRLASAASVTLEQDRWAARALAKDALATAASARIRLHCLRLIVKSLL